MPGAFISFPLKIAFVLLACLGANAYAQKPQQITLIGHVGTQKVYFASKTEKLTNNRYIALDANNSFMVMFKTKNLLKGKDVIMGILRFLR